MGWNRAFQQPKTALTAGCRMICLDFTPFSRRNSVPFHYPIIDWHRRCVRLHSMFASAPSERQPVIAVYMYGTQIGTSPGSPLVAGSGRRLSQSKDKAIESCSNKNYFRLLKDQPCTAVSIGCSIDANKYQKRLSCRGILQGACPYSKAPKLVPMISGSEVPYSLPVLYGEVDTG